MSVENTVWALDQRAGSPLAKLVLLLMADGASQDCLSRRHVEHIADEAEASEAEVQSAIDDLARRGLVSPVKDGYRLNISRD